MVAVELNGLWGDTTPSVFFYLSLDSVKLHYPATNKKKRREYLFIYKSTTLIYMAVRRLECRLMYHFRHIAVYMVETSVFNTVRIVVNVDVMM